jgi:hypothetical protein
MILNCFKIPMILYQCASVGTAKSVFDTADVWCKHEDFATRFGERVFGRRNPQ